MRSLIHWSTRCSKALASFENCGQELTNDSHLSTYQPAHDMFPTNIEPAAAYVQLSMVPQRKQVPTPTQLSMPYKINRNTMSETRENWPLSYSSQRKTYQWCLRGVQNSCLFHRTRWGGL